MTDVNEFAKFQFCRLPDPSFAKLGSLFRAASLADGEAWS